VAKIAVDLDDTVYSFTTLARRVMTKIGFETEDKQLIAAAYAAWPEWRSPTDLLGVDRWLRIIDMCHDSELILAQTPHLGAADTCNALMAAGHELLYISNRATETESATREWLYDHDFLSPSKPAELMCLMGDKTPHIADCQYFIDDRPKNLISFVYDYDWANKYGSHRNDKQRRAFGLTTEFNRALTDVPKIYLAPTWSGLNYYFQRKGLLQEQVEVGVV
jgi:hypothetical protein